MLREPQQPYIKTDDWKLFYVRGLLIIILHQDSHSFLKAMSFFDTLSGQRKKNKTIFEML